MRVRYRSEVIDADVEYDFTPGEPPSDFEYGKPLHPGSDPEWEITSINLDGIEIKNRVSETVLDMIDEEIAEKYTSL
ncbi:hypothetical protein GWN42_31475 [candidate division KSB1 bacterium]|nr:hypothetical protein [Phycisphaerae bacterium]NIQ92577.1 hypothetical protein [Deltaproteobacteria bacterium]NIV97190.1 hypothetical protein [candidate division KSB1 bacterium]